MAGPALPGPWEQALGFGPGQGRRPVHYSDMDAVIGWLCIESKTERSYSDLATSSVCSVFDWGEDLGRSRGGHLDFDRCLLATLCIVVTWMLS